MLPKSLYRSSATHKKLEIILPLADLFRIALIVALTPRRPPFCKESKETPLPPTPLVVVGPARDSGFWGFVAKFPNLLKMLLIDINIQRAKLQDTGPLLTMHQTSRLDLLICSYTHISYSSFFYSLPSQTSRLIYSTLNALQLIPRSFIHCRAKRAVKYYKCFYCKVQNTWPLISTSLNKKL